MARNRAILGRYAKAASLSSGIQRKLSDVAIGEVGKQEVSWERGTQREMAKNIHSAMADTASFLEERKAAREYQEGVDIAAEAAPGVEKIEGDWKSLGIPKYQRKVKDPEAELGYRIEPVQPEKLYTEYMAGYADEGRGYYKEGTVYQPPTGKEPLSENLKPETKLKEKGAITTVDEFETYKPEEQVTEPPKKIEDELTDQMLEDEYDLGDIWGELEDMIPGGKGS